MRGLCASADILIPNITEACFLADVDYRETYDESYINELLEKLAKLGAKTIVLTGVSYKADKTGVIVYENGNVRYYEHDKVSKGCHGTGDVYASAFVGALTRGKNAYEAAQIAADYTVECIKETAKLDNHWYGAAFEPALPKLIELIK
jgi:pyridoxine kinase